MQYSLKREKTKEQIFNAYSHLLRSKSMVHITVKDICSEAGINRSTFYTYFTDVYQLEESVEAAILARISLRVGEFLHDIGQFDAKAIVAALTEIVRTNNYLPLYIIKNAHNSFSGRLSGEIIENIKKQGIAIKAASEDEIRFFLNYHLAGVASMISDWETAQSSETIELLIEKIAKAGMSGPVSAIFELL